MSAPPMRHLSGKLLALLGALVLAGCTGVPEGVPVVRDFQLERYLGTWYEIARLDHSFERGLSRVRADYSRREEGGVRVVNRGYDAEEGEWSEAEGKAFFVEEPNVGRLKVSFFGPFYGAYNIVAIIGDYQHALVAGPGRDQLWILSRQREPDAAAIRQLLQRAEDLGFPTNELIWVEQSPAPEPPPS